MIVLDSFKDDFNLFLKNYAIYICLAVVLVIVLTILFVFVLKKKTPAKVLDSSSWLTALGGKENIVSVDATRSRLSVVLKNKDLLDKDALTLLGVSNVVSMSNKVTLVIENKAEEIKKEITK